MSAKPTLKTVHLQLPASTEDLAKLEIGTVVYLTGRIYTAREGVYKRAVEDGAGLPAPPEELGTANFHCSPAATLEPDGSANVGAVTATASFRFAKWLEGWFALSRCNIIIGKGGMTGESTSATSCPTTPSTSPPSATAPARCSAAASRASPPPMGRGTGPRAGDLGARGRELRAVPGRERLAGNSLFERENAKIAPGIEALYAGTKPATMRRYGETDDKTDEVI